MRRNSNGPWPGEVRRTWPGEVRRTWPGVSLLAPQWAWLLGDPAEVERRLALLSQAELGQLWTHVVAVQARVRRLERRLRVGS